jgi:hydrogenase-4 component B
MARVGYALAAMMGAVAVAAGIAGVLGITWTFRAQSVVPLGGLELSMDPLGGFFLAVVGLGVVPASIYAVDYMRGQRRGLLGYLVFVVAMAVLPLAANVVTFLFAWELMSLASYFLVVEGSAGAGATRDAVDAGWVYALMTHAGLAALVAGMLMLSAATGSVRFTDWIVAAPALPPGIRLGALGFLALGFAGKAGLMPLHVWLPRAHPEAPSHVSALMSGVMIKLGVYGLLRAGFDWLGVLPAAWGVGLLVVGVVSAVGGVLYAVVERDLKRLLAFSSIENIGVVVIGVGAAVIFRAADLGALAVLALVAALYHVVNHAAFKGVLFLGAGAVVHATGTRNMDAMGGIIRRMPWTAACFLLGAVAISALPPLNGFVSEWLLFQTLLQNTEIARPELNLVFTVGLAGLALTGGLTLACFVKAAGLTLLALPRGEGAVHAHEAPIAMRAGMVALCALCVALSLGATALLPALATVARSMIQAPGDAAIGAGGPFTVSVSGDFASLSTVTVAVALAAGVAATVVALSLFGASPRRRVGETWGCGRMLHTPRMEYTATAFSNPFQRVFDFVYRPVQAVAVDAHPESRFFVRTIRYSNETRSVIEDWLYTPLARGMRVATGAVRRLQSGSANLYLAYILAALLILLVLA